MKKCFATKLLLVMRICVVQGLIVLLISMSCLAHTGFAQLLDKPVTVHLSDVPFVDALKEIGESANIRFVYSADQLTSESNVSLTAKQMPLRQLLEELLDPREITYKVHEREASITLRKRVSETPVRESHDRQGNVHRKVQQITGQVTDGSTALPMPGVNILVKGTLTGTTTDNEGHYVIEANENDILVFSFIGYAPVEALVGKRTTIDITLSEDIMRLQDVVINAGYWEVKDQERTGNISKVDAATIEKQPINNPLQALQGRMTGVYIQQNTGVAGGAFNIQIRGRNSLRTGSGGTVNGNLPLYIIDGIPFTSTSLNSTYLSSSNLYGGNPLSAINPSDIESIEILKDADATAIYGSRGANGVVLITTKKAKAGKTKFDINVSRGIGQVSNKMKLLSTAQYLEMRMEGLENDGYTSRLEDPQYDVQWPDLKLWDQNRETDWQEKLIGGTAGLTNAQLSLSGGNANTQFLVSGGYYGETTVFPGDGDFKRGSARISLNHSSVDGRLRLSSSVSFNVSANKLPISDFTSTALTLPPNAPALYTAAGELNWENGTWRNPLSVLERKYSGNTDNLVMNATASYEILPGLEFKSSVGITRMQVNEVSINPLTSRDPAQRIGQTGSSNFAEGSTRTWIAEPQLSYSHKLASGNIILLAGTTFQQSVQQGKTIGASGFSSDALLENIDAATTLNVMDARFSQYRYMAAFARVNYNLGGKYIINLTGRRDGSSRFGSGNRFANFGAVGAAWIFSEETWLKDHFNIISFGKLRGSYGTTGSDAIGDYQFLDTFTPTTYPYNSTSGLYVSRLSNPDYSWETNRKTEIGLELGFFQDRISLLGAYYRNKSSNQLVGLPLPVLTGHTSVQFNLPATVENTGFEVQLTTVNVRKNIEWSTDFNITIPNNRLVAFPELEKFSAYRNRYDVGKSLFIYKAYEYEGVDPETGLYTFKDRNGDGTFSSAFDYIGLKEITQKYFGGINNSLRFKGFQLDLFIQFVKQTGRDYMDAFPVPGNMANQPEIVMSRWQNEGDLTDIQRFTVVDPGSLVIRRYNYKLSSNNAVTDASFIRLRNVYLSWELPGKWIQKAQFKRARLYIQGQNLITITNYQGLDPETMTSASLPPLRIFTAGINLAL